MAIHARMAANSNRGYFLGIERIADNAQFNFSSGAFETAASPMLMYPFTQDPKLPGRYMIEAPHQQLLQFNGIDCCFWLFRSNGQAAPNDMETVWLESGSVSLPFVLNDDVYVISISEPQAAF